MMFPPAGHPAERPSEFEELFGDLLRAVRAPTPIPGPWSWAGPDELYEPIDPYRSSTKVSERV